MGRLPRHSVPLSIVVMSHLHDKTGLLVAVYVLTAHSASESQALCLRCTVLRSKHRRRGSGGRLDRTHPGGDARDTPRRRQRQPGAVAVWLRTSPLRKWVSLSRSISCRIWCTLCLLTARTRAAGLKQADAAWLQHHLARLTGAVKSICRCTGQRSDDRAVRDACWHRLRTAAGCRVYAARQRRRTH